MQDTEHGPTDLTEGSSVRPGLSLGDKAPFSWFLQATALLATTVPAHRAQEQSSVPLALFLPRCRAGPQTRFAPARPPRGVWRESRFFHRRKIWVVKLGGVLVIATAGSRWDTGVQSLLGAREPDTAPREAGQGA